MKIDSITLAVPGARTFTYDWAGKEETETMHLPPYAHVSRGATITRTYWYVRPASMRRLFRAMEALCQAKP